MRPTRFLTRVSATALIAYAGFMPGCDKDPVNAELQRADVLLSSLTSAGYTAMPSDDRRREDLQWIVNRLTGKSVAGLPNSMTGKGVKGVSEDLKNKISTDLPTLSVAPTESPIPSQAGAANLMVARALAGLGEIHAKDQQVKEAALLSRVAVIRAGVSEWAALNALARGHEAYDPAADIQRLEAQITQRQQEQAAKQQAKTAQDTLIDELTRKASDATAKADAERTREAELRARLAGASQTERARLMEEANRIRRVGDGFEKEASNLLAEASKEQPKAQVLQRELDLANQQIVLLREAIASAQDRAAKGHAAADAARASAQETSQRIDQLIADAKGLRTNADTPSNEALDLYSKAITRVKAAQTKFDDAQSKGVASATAATFAQSTGDIQAARARGLILLAGVLESASSDKSPLPNAAAYRQSAETYAAQAKDARKAAKDAYEAAKELFAKAGFKEKERAEAIDKSLDSLAKLFDDTQKTPAADPKDQTPPSEPGVEPAGKPAPEAAAGEGAPFDKAAVEAEVRAFLQKQIDDVKAGDTKSALAALEFEDAAEGKLLAGLIPFGHAMQSLDGACKEKFTKGFSDLLRETQVDSVRSNPVLGMLSMVGAMAGDMGDFGSVSAADAPLSVHAADDVEITFQGQPPMHARKRDAGWRLVMPPMGLADGPMAGQLKMAVPMLVGATPVLESVAADTKASKYADADAMLTELAAKLTGALGKMPGMPGGAKPGSSPPSPPGGG